MAGSTTLPVARLTLEMRRRKSNTAPQRLSPWTGTPLLPGREQTESGRKATAPRVVGGSSLSSGQRLRARNMHPAGYGRPPRYTRGKLGTIARDGPAGFAELWDVLNADQPQSFFQHPDLVLGKLLRADRAMPRVASPVDIRSLHPEAATDAKMSTERWKSTAPRARDKSRRNSQPAEFHCDACKVLLFDKALYSLNRAAAAPLRSPTSGVKSR
jgi:hypothetical protein